MDSLQTVACAVLSSTYRLLRRGTACHSAQMDWMMDVDVINLYLLECTVKGLESSVIEFSLRTSSSRSTKYY